MKYFIHQLGYSDCGYTCLKILLAKLNHDQNYLFDTKYFNNLSLLEMKNILKENKVEAKGVEVDSVDNLKDFYYPILVIKNSNANHYVLLKKVTKKSVVIIDPAKGKRIIKKEDFKKIFTKYALISTRNKKKIKSHKKVKLFDRNYLISYISSLFIDFGFIYFLGFTIKNEKDFLLSFLLFLGMIINLIFKLITIFSYSSMFDKKYVEPLIERKIDPNELEIIGKYKISKINIFKNIGVIMATFFVTFVLSVNQILNLYYIVIVEIFLLFKKVVLENIYIIYQEKISKLEEEYYLKRDKECYKSINHFSKRLVLFKVVEKITIIIIIFIYLLFLSYFIKEKSINFILFYFFSYYSLYELMNLISNFDVQFVELKNNYLHYQRIEDKYK